MSAENQSIAIRACGCIVGWSGAQVPTSDRAYWAEQARRAGYKVTMIAPSDIAPKQTWNCEHPLRASAG